MFMHTPNRDRWKRSRSEARFIHEAVLRAFSEPTTDLSRLHRLSRKEWGKLLRWLDMSGLALYFFDRVTELGRCDVFPPEVSSALRQRLSDNTERTRGMLTEQTAIQRGFQSEGLSYALLKGFSLWPSSVPRPELRSQLDLDFLVAEQGAPAARQVLEGRGYRLHAVSGKSWEFKAKESDRMSLKDLYKDLPGRTVELHMETKASKATSLLSRVDTRSLGGICTPVLTPPALLLGQGLHLYKHVSGESARAAHLVEFYRHVVARRADETFWSELRLLAEENRRATIALGVVTLLITRLMGSFAPEELSRWTVDCLPPAVRLWVKLYGHRSVLPGFPGTKLYLFLEKELEHCGVPAARSVRRSLLPRTLPPALVHPAPNERLSARLRRYQTQLWFITFRLRFHAVEGLRYAYESQRWRRRLKGLSR